MKLCVNCSLCGQEFDLADPLIKERLKRHSEFHEHCKIQKRNTAEGTVEWKGVSDEITSHLRHDLKMNYGDLICKDCGVVLERR
jgi:transcription elongation factor Elf1